MRPNWSALDPRCAQGASLLFEAWLAYADDVRRLTLAARGRFLRREWQGAHDDSVARLLAYRRRLDEAIAGLGRLYGADLKRKEPWRELKALFGDLAQTLPDIELAETFFNSATRRVFSTVGIDPEIEFVSPVAELPPPGFPSRECELFAPAGSLEELLSRVLAAHGFGFDNAALAADVGLAAERLRAELGAAPLTALEVVRSVFYRGQGAYLVGRLHGPAPPLPLVLALSNPAGTPRLDAVLTSEDEVSIVFSYTRSYFFVESTRPRDLVAFLKVLMPKKPVADLYNATGQNKHGKTELYRALLHHLATSDDRFEIARGERGMVMVVFDLPGFDSVFKIIRDRFEQPKSTTRDEVKAKYRLVFEHDRAGRLVDAQEFEHLAFARSRFTPELLAELAAKCSGSVRDDGETVEIDHLYTERRLVPLDVYLREAPPERARAAVLDFGQTLRDLAATNIFPGDLLLKNFGVTRHDRVVFYDYDELCLVSELSFRELPEASSDDEETAGEAWYYVGEKDVFPQEFITFFGLRGAQRDQFLSAHRALLDPAFWRALQERFRAGELTEVLPYPESRRLRPG